MAIEDDDKVAAAGAVARRITLEDIKAEIELVMYNTGDELIRDRHAPLRLIDRLNVLTICTMVTRSGFVVLGKSSPMSKENYKPALGEKFAYEDAIRQLWAHFAFHALQAMEEERAMAQPHRGHHDDAAH